MQESKNIKTLYRAQETHPSLIIDKSGRIIALNSDVKRVIPEASAQSNFFELFEEQTLLSMQRLFIDARKYETVTKEVIELKTGSGPANYEVAFTPLRSDNNIYFSVNLFQNDEKKSEGETKKFWIAAAELEKVTDDKRILSIVNKIKHTYPFTFIEKAKIQKEINELEEYFWVKEPSGKYIIVNDNYAASLGFSSSQLENKKEEDYLPKYLVNLYRTVDHYVLESTNSVILESASSPISADAKKNHRIIQFPICDLDNKVVAIIGFSKQINSDSPVQATFDFDFYKDIPQPLLLLDKNNRVILYSNYFIAALNLKKEADYKSLELKDLFDANFLSLVEPYLNDIKKSDPLEVNYSLSQKENKRFVVHIKKLFDNSGNYHGAQLIFESKADTETAELNKAMLYDALIQSIPQAMFIYDLDNLRFLEVNNAALNLYGYKKEDFLNMDLTDLYAPEDVQTLIQSSEGKSSSVNFTGPWRHKKKDGSSVLVEINRVVVDYKNKKAHLNIISNVSEKSEEKKKLQILNAVYEHTGDLIINTDKDGFITEINDNVSKRFGYAKKETETRPLVSLVSDEDRAKINKNIFHSGILKPTSLEVNFKKTTGELQKTTVYAAPIKNYSGEIESYSFVVKPAEDFSQSKEMKQAHDEVTGRIDSSFLSNMFHEILTPINVIMGFTQEIWESISNPNDEQKEAVDIIKENQKLLLQIMDNAVEYSSLEQKVVKFKPEPIKFTDILDDIKENTRKVAEAQRVELSYGKISSSLTLETDKQKMISLLSLLIKFAMHLTKENTIYLSAFNYNDDQFAVAIKDTRNAITPYLLKGLNDVFSSEENLSRRNYGFSRFSMRLANKLMTLLSAKKDSFSKSGEVVEYGLIIPNKFVVGEEGNYEIEAPKPQPRVQTAAPVEPTQQKELDLSKLTCLYFEDQVDSQVLFKSQMKDLKSIEFAQSLEAALPLLKTKRFDFLIVDINLQGEYNGLDALRIIQKMPGFKDVPMIATTAYMQPGARDNFIAAGFTEFIPKPLLRDRIIEILKRIF